MDINHLLNKTDLNQEELVYLLKTKGKEREALFSRAAEVKKELVGNKVYFRGLVEYSNRCAKSCYYCGVGRDNKAVHRYTLENQEVLEAAKYAWENQFASMVIQSGERSDKHFVDKIEYLLKEIKKLSQGGLGITLSMGEQTEETYTRWFQAGAHRYLLRIEASDPELYKKMHPNDALHSYERRLEALHLLRKTGYQVGTGVMIGLPFQSYENLAHDLLFFKRMDIDMCGMGPYIEHEQTPLYQFKDQLMPKLERFDLSLKMVALLRIIMPDINIAATTAMQTLDKMGREKAIKVGANVIMPNLTPVKYREDYLLYEDKPCLDEEADECKNCLEARIFISGDEIGYGEWGDSLRFKNRKL